MGQGQRLPSSLYSRCGGKASHNVGEREKNCGQFGTIDAASSREKKIQIKHCIALHLVIGYGQGKEAAHRVRFKSVQFGGLASQVEGLD